MFCHQSNKIKSLLSSFLVYSLKKFYSVHHYLNLYAKLRTVCSSIQINKNISSWYLYHTQLVFIINNKSVHVHLQIKYFSQKYIFCKEIFAIFQLSASPYHLLVHQWSHYATTNHSDYKGIPGLLATHGTKPKLLRSWEE